MKKQINDKLIDMTAEEIAEAEKRTSDRIARKEQEAIDKKAKADLKASAKAKLVAGEPLTEAEADTLVI
tara:strand:- start:38 stop:244 length:207 start_codon:yes stop_codon:yes gene_type:complete